MAIPTAPGEYKWRDSYGEVIVSVVDVGADFGNGHEPYLRVYWQGGYYNLTPDEHHTADECWPAEGWVSYE